MNKVKQKGVSIVVMLAVLLAISFFAVGLDYWGDLKRSELRDNSYELMVKHEADTIEYALKAIDTWFNLKGRAELYSCEVVTANCDVNVLKNILPAYYGSITTQEYNSINSVGLGFKAGVIKVPDAAGSGWVYKTVLYPNL